jgi:membrane protease YdiL (CAAX protease family)
VDVEFSVVGVIFMPLRAASLLNTAQGYELLAGGSLGHPPATVRPRLQRRAWLFAEMVLFFVGVPLLMRWAIYDLHIPLILVLQPLLLGFVIYLLWDDTFHVRRELSKGFAWRHLLWIGLVFAIVGGSIAFATSVVFPERFLGFPLYRPKLWMLLMLLYPLLSVIPQELVYRTFFFHRYGPILDGNRWLAVAINGALFGFAHIIFNNWIAVAGSAVIGSIIAYRYWMTRSFWAAWFEHTLYGCLVFTVGLGAFFFTGISNF